MHLSGGFGRFQLYVFVVLTLSFMTGGYIVYGITFLTDLPAYECKDALQRWKTCTAEEICQNDMAAKYWRVDYESKDTYINWVEEDKLNLRCVDKNKIGLFGSMYFVGFAISSGFVPRVADKFGRKKPYMWSLTL